MMRIIDLNADVGETSTAEGKQREEELMQYVSSVNIACGGHAGDPESMSRTLEFARAGVAAGAHPSYPDRENFGRLELDMKLHELRASLLGQIEALREIAERIDVRITHVKPHGALYHAANSQPEIARMIAGVVRSIDPTMTIFAQAGSAASESYRQAGLHVVFEAFADRAYEPDGGLRNRKLPGALLTPVQASGQAIDIALHQRVRTSTGELRVEAETICIHSDTPDCIAIAQAIRRDLAVQRVKVARFDSNIRR